MAQVVVGDAGEHSACIAGHCLCSLNQVRRVHQVRLRDRSSMELSGRRRHRLGHTESSKPLKQ